MEAWGNQSRPQRVGICSLERTPRQQAGQASQLVAVAAKASLSLLAAHHLCASLGLHSVSHLLCSLEATLGEKRCRQSQSSMWRSPYPCKKAGKAALPAGVRHDASNKC